MKKKFFRRFLLFLVSAFILLNIITIFHAWKFTHFDADAAGKPKTADELTTTDKISMLFLGVDNPKPENTVVPHQEYETISIRSDLDLSCWSIRADQSKGTVILFHGYRGCKSGMISRADAFLSLGYNTLLVDFRGSGESAGDQTTIGFREAADVKAAYEYIAASGEENIFLFGSSMGAAAILKAVNDFGLDPDGIMLECPFGSMYDATAARFEMMHAPAFPLAGMLTFWGGILNGFPAFEHNPQDYAKGVACPTLLIYGAQDARVSREETDRIYANLAGAKTLKVYQQAGHNDFLAKAGAAWYQDISCFMERD